MRNPILIDRLYSVLNEPLLSPLSNIGGIWYFSRPVHGRDLPERIYHAWLVLAGRADAHQYAEDRPAIMARLLAPDGAGEVAP